jgi:cytochrome c oxidase subunit 1
MVVGLAVILGNLLVSARRGPAAPANPWGAATLEWTLPSPPPLENWEEPPTVTKGPYDFSGVEEPK